MNALPEGSLAAYVFLTFGLAFMVLVVGYFAYADGMLALVGRFARYVWARAGASVRLRLGRTRRHLFGRGRLSTFEPTVGRTIDVINEMNARNNVLHDKALVGDFGDFSRYLVEFRAASGGPARPVRMGRAGDVPVFDDDFLYANRYGIDVRFLVAIRMLWELHDPPLTPGTNELFAGIESMGRLLRVTAPAAPPREPADRHLDL